MNFQKGSAFSEGSLFTIGENYHDNRMVSRCFAVMRTSEKFFFPIR